MTADVGLGTLVSQTKIVSHPNTWDEYCGYVITYSPQESWLTVSQPSTHDLKIDVLSSDLSLQGTTRTFSVTLTPDYQDDSGPVAKTYTFDV